MTLKNDSSPQYLAVPADCFKLYSPLVQLVKNHGRTMWARISLFLAVLKCARNPMHSPHKIARDCQANEDDTVAVNTLIDLLGKHLKILILSFAKKHISPMCCEPLLCTLWSYSSFETTFNGGTEAGGFKTKWSEAPNTR